ncbi:hypothetical protein TPR58_14230 [Sphingomonas sp. HF-S3]|uniref:DUF11 domain-containing protein n=1 Tax=Sphingomonas rustica TaxID=3103142 RepID=A0ABV0B9S8_9SPHN
MIGAWGSFATVPALASATPAGEILPNTASVTYSINGQQSGTASNTVNVRVNEVLDIDLGALTSQLAIERGALSPVPFTLTNAGNGQEAFILSGELQGIDGVIEAFAIDRDGDGRFDPAVDLRIELNGATPRLAPGTVLPLLVLVRGNTAANGRLIVDARAVTGSGTPGTDFSGKGDDGCDAIVGATTAAARTSITLTIAGGDPSQIDVVKSQSVASPDGGTSPVRGAIVTYTIESRFGGSGTVQDARLADPIPAGTDYVPGSLLLDGTALTDADGDDAGSFDGGGIRIALGDIAGPVTRIVKFQVTIK